VSGTVQRLEGRTILSVTSTWHPGLVGKDVNVLFTVQQPVSRPVSMGRSVAQNAFFQQFGEPPCWTAGCGISNGGDHGVQ
jgi:hypothetical protein